MKPKNYEKKAFISLFTIFLLGFEIIGICTLHHTKIREYKLYQAIHQKTQFIQIIIEKEDKSLFEKNVYLFFKNKKYKYTIEKIEEIHSNQKTYYDVVLKVPLKEKPKESEMIEISIEKRKTNIIDIIKNTWGGDKK